MKDLRIEIFLSEKNKKQVKEKFCQLINDGNSYNKSAEKAMKLLKPKFSIVKGDNCWGKHCFPCWKVRRRWNKQI